MANNKENINQKDLFSEAVKEKLAEHKFPAGDELWKRIEQGMHQPPKKRVSPLWWISGAAVAAVLAFILLPYGFDKENLTTTTETLMAEQTDIMTGQQNDYGEDPTLIASSESVRHSTSMRKERKRGEAGITKIEREEIDTKRDTLSDNKTNIQEKAAVEDYEKEVKREVLDTLPDLNDYPNYTPSLYNKKKKSGLLLAASTGAGNRIELNSNSSDYYFSAQNDPIIIGDDVPERYNSLSSAAAQQLNVKHHPEVTVKFTALKKLNSRIGVEAGVSYSFLKTSYTKSFDNDYYVESQLHYLGVPLNLYVTVVDQPDWGLYVSGGGMVEKGISNNYFDKGGDTFKEAIDGLQWSTGFAAGVEYKIVKNLRLFVEPKLTYYFDNNQPESIRTDKPISLGVNGGLRIEL